MCGTKRGLQIHNVWLTLLVVLLPTVLAGCRQSVKTAQDAMYQIVLEETLFAPAVGPAELRFVVTDGAQQRVDGLTLTVKGDMTHPGMVPVVREVSQSENGVYVVPWEWTMMGEWVVTVTAVDSTSSSTQTRFNLNVTGDDAFCAPEEQSSTQKRHPATA